MEKEQKISVLWDYYKAAAEIQSMDKEKGTQANYSLLWAFRGSLEELPSLVLAFLGDSAAMDALNWSAASPTGWEDFLLEGQPLNESQAEAVRLALAAPLSFIQGPPGTGKTETILNLASCAARMNGGSSVAIVSSNKDALKNIQEKIASFSDAAPNRRWLRSHYAALGKASIREEFRKAHPDDPLCAFGRPAEEEISGTDPRPFSREKNIRAGDFLEKYPVISSTIHSLKNCFRDGNTYLYDYVIMDESSQTNTVAGLVAMSCARHLVLVGDPKQLPPVVPEHYVTRLDQLVRERGWVIPAEHPVTPDRSFLDVCLDVFRGRTAQVTLRFHYRCHPGIIGFCAKEIYREERLEICTPRWDTGVQTPIKVLWFEGNYCEKRIVQKKDARKKKTEKPQSSETGAGRISKHNRKQVQCFMEEEWPALWERLQLPEQERPSVCILSPFLGQLASLEEAIQNDLSARKHPPKGLKLFLEDGDTNQSGQGFEPPTLTIHKSQGHEYDIVYLLPAEDGDWEWPWSQKKRLVNVAVSRAKKELRLILSSTLMDEEIQQTLTGRPILPEKKDPDPGKAQDERFLQKLVRYVRERNKALEQKTDIAGYPASTYTYGFHRSARTSIFDRVPWERAIQSKNKPEGEIGMGTIASTPEYCVESALIHMIRTYCKEKGISLALYKHVMLQDICLEDGRRPEVSPEAADLVKNGGHLDFALCREDRILLAIEVNGEFHRTPDKKGEEQRNRDKIKKAFFRDSLHAACFEGNLREGQDLAQKGSLAFIGLDDDGATCLEFLELWENADTEMKQRYFPLEELLEPRLNAADDHPSVHIPARPISGLIKEWGGNWDDPGSSWLDLNGKKDTASTRANQELIFQSLLYEIQHPLLSKKAVVPTNQGQKEGIIEVIRLDKENKPYAYALYPGRIQKIIADYLNSYRLMAGMEIEKLLKKVYPRLDRYLQDQGTEEEKVKALKELSKPINFTNNELCYEDQLTQAVYLMRYLYAYAYEYKCMYQRLIAREPHLSQKLSVTSIGCGNMVDYWALRSALQEHSEISVTVDYTGVDIANWSNWLRIRAADGDRVEFIQKDAVEYLRQQAAHSAASDVYIFPKSISEFDGRENVGGAILSGIRNGLRDVLRTSGKKQVWLLFSIPRSMRYRENDRKKCALLLESVQEAGYVTEDPKDWFTITPYAQRRKIDEADQSFSFPKNILDELSSYTDTEPGNEPDEKNEEGSEIRVPVLFTNYDNYQVLLFRRKE